MHRALRPIFLALLVVALVSIARFSKNVRNVDAVGLVASGVIVGSCAMGLLGPRRPARRPTHTS
jgi:hypothetical protein